MQTDVHAAASALLLAGVAGLGLMSGISRPEVGAGLLLLLIAIGLWITGSRVAIVLGVVTTRRHNRVVGQPETVAGRRFRRCRRRHACGRGRSLAHAEHAPAVDSPWHDRTFSRTPGCCWPRPAFRCSNRMPVFGIGITRFYAASARYLSGPLLRSSELPRERAQQFPAGAGRTGLVGLGALLWWLAVVLGGGVRAQCANPCSESGMPDCGDRRMHRNVDDRPPAARAGIRVCVLALLRRPGRRDTHAAHPAVAAVAGHCGCPRECAPKGVCAAE